MGGQIVINICRVQDMPHIIRSSGRHTPDKISGRNKHSHVRVSKQEFPIPASPVIIAALRAMFAGGPRNKWNPDSYGRPRYCYDARDGSITFSFAPPPDFSSRFHISKVMYYSPRLAFIHSGRLRSAVHELSVETADVFLILMSRIADLRDPARDIASIRLDDIAVFRDVRVRHGSTRNLLEDFKSEILRLADIRLTMTWRDYATGGTITFGREIPDCLLDIVDVKYSHSGSTWTSFRYRCGQALSHFLSPEGLRWIGYYSKALLKLSPYHEALTKKIGTYWTMVGVIAGKKGSQPRATPRSILDFCGEHINWRNPGQTVDGFIKAHERLTEIGILTDVLTPEVFTRTRGYFRDWLETPVTVKLSDDLWRMKPRPRASSRKSIPPRLKVSDKRVVSPPPDSQVLIAEPGTIRTFRNGFFIHQAELAHALGIKRQTLSNYERGLRTLPKDKADRILQIWRRRLAEP